MTRPAHPCIIGFCTVFNITLFTDCTAACVPARRLRAASQDLVEVLSRPDTWKTALKHDQAAYQRNADGSYKVRSPTVHTVAQAATRSRPLPSNVKAS